MKNFLRTIQQWLGGSSVPGQSAPRVAVVRQYTSPTPTLQRSGTRVVINRVPRPYWEERGWRQEAGVYQGHYQTRFGNWPGYITVSPSRRVEVFIHNPPAALQRHPHWQCFNKRNDGWFFVHPVTPVTDVSAGIINLEKQSMKPLRIEIYDLLIRWLQSEIQRLQQEQFDRARIKRNPEILTERRGVGDEKHISEASDSASNGQLETAKPVGLECPKTVGEESLVAPRNPPGEARETPTPDTKAGITSPVASVVGSERPDKVGDESPDTTPKPMVEVTAPSIPATEVGNKTPQPLPVGPERPEKVRDESSAETPEVGREATALSKPFSRGGITSATPRESFPQTFVIESFFARELIAALTRGRNEDMHFLTGPKVGPIRIVCRWARPVSLNEQSPVFVGATARSVADVLIPIIEQGAELHICAHSHPGGGAGATTPSDTDMKCLGKLQRSGSPAIGCIVTRDGHLRFFSVTTNFHALVLGSGVKEITQNVFHIAPQNRH